MATMESLVQNFDNNALNSWTQAGAGTPANQVKVQNGQVEITTTGVSGNYNWLESPTSYDLTGSYAFVRLISAGTQAANLDCNPVLLSADVNNQVFFSINGGNLLCYKLVATVQTQVGSTVAYSASIHRWFRLLEASGTTYWQYSQDGESYQTITSLANPITVTALTVRLQAGQFGAASADTMKYDNFNFRNSGYQRIGVGDGMSTSEKAN